MGLHDDILIRSKENKANKCKVGLLIDTMSPEDRDALACAFQRWRANDPLFTQTWITQTLVKNGYVVGKTALSDHINERCVCERS